MGGKQSSKPRGKAIAPKFHHTGPWLDNDFRHIAAAAYSTVGCDALAPIVIRVSIEHEIYICGIQRIGIPYHCIEFVIGALTSIG